MEDAEKEKKAGEAFLTKAASEKGSVKTTSGIVITTIKEGKGASPKDSDTVKVHYHGTLLNGKGVQEQTLRSGDVIRIGSTVMRYSIEDETTP